MNFYPPAVKSPLPEFYMLQKSVGVSRVSDNEGQCWHYLLFPLFWPPHPPPCLVRVQCLQWGTLCARSPLQSYELPNCLRQCILAYLQLIVTFVYSLPPAIFLLWWPFPLEKAGCFNLPPQQLSLPSAFLLQEVDHPLVPDWGYPGWGFPLFSSHLWSNLSHYSSMTGYMF